MSREERSPLLMTSIQMPSTSAPVEVNNEQDSAPTEGVSAVSSISSSIDAESKGEVPSVLFPILPPLPLYPTLQPLEENLTECGGGGSMTSPPTSALTLTWHNISVWVPVKSMSLLPCFGEKPQPTQILDKVSGTAKSGRLVAIMGASGAGKTTLLATISQRIKGWSKGDIRVNGDCVTGETLRRLAGFVPQQDLAIETLNVKEHMLFMGRLKAGVGKSAELQQKTAALLTELGLSKCSYTRLSSLSGGERKRLALAVQLLTDPPILFCDEPTTGLDSYSARAVVEKLRRLGETRGMAIVCTIHQPASGLFDLFHDLLLLAGGRVAYHGETRAAHEYFSKLGLTCPAAYNAADFYVSQLAIKPGLEAQCSERVSWLCDNFAASPEAATLGQELDSYVQKASEETTSPKRSFLDQFNEEKKTANTDWTYHLKSKRRTQLPCYLQLYWLLWRGALDARRNKTVTLVRMVSFFLVGTIISLPFMGLRADQQSGVQDMQGLFYLIVVETIFTFAYSVFNTFPHEMPVLLREIGDALYKPGPYYISKMIMLIPRCVVTPFFYTLVIFCIVGLEGGIKGFILLCIPVMMCAISASAYGCMLSAMFESVSTASLLSVPLDFITLTCSGLFLNLTSVPLYVSWIRYISQFYYANEAVSILQWTQVTSIDCWDIPDATCLHNGREVLTKFGFSEANLPYDLLGLLGIYSFTHVVGFLSLLRRSKKQATY